MIDISVEENMGKLVKEIKERLTHENIVNEEIDTDYLKFGSFEEKLVENNILITKLEQGLKSVMITLVSMDIAVRAVNEAIFAAGGPPVLKFDPETLSLDIDGKRSGNSHGKLDFLYFKTCLLSLPFNLLKEITVKNIIEEFDYNENEFIFKEFYRLIACGGKLYIECKDIPFYINFFNQYNKIRSKSIDAIDEITEYEKIIKKSADEQYNFFSPENMLDYFLKNNKLNSTYSSELLRAYLEYCGFVSVFSKTTIGEYTAGKIKINAVKLGLKELASMPKRVLLKMNSDKFEDLFSFSVFIRNLHNAFNKWDLLLVIDKNRDFFKNNVYLKYLSNIIPEESVDYIINTEDADSLPEIDYPLKHIDSGKPDVFSDNDDIKAANKFLENHGVKENEPFLILDGEYIKTEEQRPILNLAAKDFPYFNLNDFKILSFNFKGGNDSGLSLKIIAEIINMSSFYAGGGFMFKLADGLCVPSYDLMSDKVNYARSNEGEAVCYDVSIIIPVFNNIDYTKNCLTSIFKNHPLVNFEIIVVNNASTDGTEDYLKGLSCLNNFTVINNNVNSGYAKACNQGAKASRGKYLHFLNNDMIVFKGAIDELVNTAFKAGNRFGAVGSLLLYSDGKIQHAGVVFVSIDGIVSPYHQYKGMGIFGCEELYAKNTIMYKKYNAVTAASILLKKELFFSIDSFDEIYKNGFEDVDLCLKIKEARKDIIFNPRSMLVHFEEKTEGRRKYDIENGYHLLDKWQFRYSDDDYIFAENCDFKIFKNYLHSNVKYYTIRDLKKLESDAMLCLNSGDYKRAAELCDDILAYNRLDIRAYRRKMDLEKLIKKP
ncbi:glycosyltransferase family 2 protein [Candidatus Acidulodesulfobacterium sp. H_13]|uniref:glycosyltransferase family 2 protein n=1 Tax=Candidatus Acidulodesulfobacterium sp. H_13 TaxID=3395470 RepID=UPI003AF561EF